MVLPKNEYLLQQCDLNCYLSCVVCFNVNFKTGQVTKRQMEMKRNPNVFQSYRHSLGWCDHILFTYVSVRKEAFKILLPKALFRLDSVVVLYGVDKYDVNVVALMKQTNNSICQKLQLLLHKSNRLSLNLESFRPRGGKAFISLWDKAGSSCVSPSAVLTAQGQSSCLVLLEGSWDFTLGLLGGLTAPSGLAAAPALPLQEKRYITH